MCIRDREESKRVSHYLSSQTDGKLRGIAENELILTHCKTLLEMDSSGFVCMLRDNKLNDLRRMYSLFLRIPSCVDQMREAMGEGDSSSSKHHIRLHILFIVRRQVRQTEWIRSAGQSRNQQ